MNQLNNRTKNTIRAACAYAFGLAMGAAIAAPRAASAPEPDGDPAMAAVHARAPVVHRDEVIVTEPVYIVVDRQPGAPMATGDLSVQSITFSEPTRIQVYRTPQDAFASAEPHGLQDDRQE
jgi:hypothetical protein